MGDDGASLSPTLTPPLEPLRPSMLRRAGHAPEPMSDLSACPPGNAGGYARPPYQSTPSGGLGTYMDRPSPDIQHLDDQFFTPRAGSPFFTPRTGSPFLPTAMSSASAMARGLSRSSGMSSTSEGSSQDSVKAFAQPRHLTASQLTSQATTELALPPSGDSEVSSLTERGSMATLSPSRPPSSVGQSVTDAETSLEGPEEPLPPSSANLSDTSPTDTAAAVPSSSELLTGSSQLSVQLHQSLVAEGLSETAAAAQQELRALESRIRQDGHGPTFSHQGLPLTSVELSERQISASSEISRTPSTSTNGSIAANSSASVETAPSSVLSDSEASGDVTEVKETSRDDGETAIGSAAPDDKVVQSRIRRYHALLELVDTEQSYARDLSVLLHVYLEFLPTHKYFEDHPSRLEVIMRNLPDICKVHTEIAADLDKFMLDNHVAHSDPGDFVERAMSTGLDFAMVSIAKYLEQKEPALHVYQDFCARHSEALAIMRESEKRHNGEDSAAFEKLCWDILRSQSPSPHNSRTTDLGLKQQLQSGASTPGGVFQSTPIVGSASPRFQSASTGLAPLTPMNPDIASFDNSPTPGASRFNNRLSFAHLIIKPVQRLCLYPLVLHTLLKHTGPGECGHSELLLALAAMRRAADQVDEANKKREQFLLAELVASRVDSQGAITRSLLSTFGNVQLSGTLDVLYHQVTEAPLAAPLRFRFLGLFLYQQGCLIVKVRKSGNYEPRHWFPLAKAKLSSIEEHEGVLPHAYRLTITGGHHFELAASSSRERALWVDRLSSAISDATIDSEADASSGIPKPSNSQPSHVKFPSSLAMSAVSAQHQRYDGPLTPRGDPLSEFLTRQSSTANSSEVLVRYASLSQRSVVDRGMIFSETVLAARAITHKDGTFTPGGSITKSSASTTPGSTTPTAISAAGLTAWPASANTSTSSLGAAVGAAMGLARVTRRASRHNINGNVFEIAAQQYLASEDQRRNDVSKQEQQQQEAGNAVVPSRTSMDGFGFRSCPSSPKSGATKVQHKKRGSFAGRNSIRPLSTFVGLGSALPSQKSPTMLDDASLVASPQASPSNLAEDESFADEFGAMMPAERVYSDLTSLTSGAGQQRPLRRRQSFLGVPNLMSRDSAPNTWSRRGRSQSANVGLEKAALAMTESRPISSHQGVFPSSKTEDTTGKATSAEDPISRPRSALRRALTGLSDARNRSQSIIAPPAELSDSPPLSPRRALDGTGRASLALLERNDTSSVPPQARSERRRTSSSFGNSFGIMGPPIETLRRSMSNTARWAGVGSGSRSASSSRRSSVIADEPLNVQSAAGGQQRILHDSSLSMTPAAPQGERFPFPASGQTFSRSATDTELVGDPAVVASSQPAARPTTPRSLTGPPTKLASLSADFLSKARLSGSMRGQSLSPASKTPSRKSSAGSLSAVATQQDVPQASLGLQTGSSLTIPSSSGPSRAVNPRRTNRLSVIFGRGPQQGGGTTNFSSHSRSGSSEGGDVVSAGSLPAPVAVQPRQFSFSGGTSADALSALPSPLAEENENPFHLSSGEAGAPPRSSSDRRGEEDSAQ